MFEDKLNMETNMKVQQCLKRSFKHLKANTSCKRKFKIELKHVQHTGNYSRACKRAPTVSQKTNLNNELLKDT